MEKGDKEYVVNLINEFIAAETQTAVIFWSVLSPEQRQEFEGKLKTVIARDEAQIRQPSHRTGILKALLKNLEHMGSRLGPSDTGPKHLKAVPDIFRLNRPGSDKP